MKFEEVFKSTVDRGEWEDKSKSAKELQLYLKDRIAFINSVTDDDLYSPEFFDAFCPDKFYELMESFDDVLSNFFEELQDNSTFMYRDFRDLINLVKYAGSWSAFVKSSIDFVMKNHVGVRRRKFRVQILDKLNSSLALVNKVINDEI